MNLFIFLPAHLPMAPRPLQGELLSSWLGRLAAANALGFEELLDVLRVRLASSPRGPGHSTPAGWITPAAPL